MSKGTRLHEDRDRRPTVTVTRELSRVSIFVLPL